MPRRLATGLTWADLALLAVGVGIWYRFRQWSAALPLWLDEQFIAVNIRDRGYGDLVGKLDYVQSAPLGWLWLQRLVTELAGTGDRVLRVVPLAFGIGTLVLLWWVGRRWLGALGTVTAVVLCAASPSLIQYSVEVKQYSSDAFWTLALVALAGWALEQPRPHRIWLWWAVGALACWFSTGAVLAMPPLALILLAVAWREGGWRSAVRAGLGGFGWFASFAVVYLLSLRHTLAEPIFFTFWAPRGFPPQDAAAVETWSWILTRFELVAADPIGTPHAGLFWILVGLGVAAGFWRRWAFGWVLLAPLLTGFALALARVVPFTGRLALWLVPLLFLAVGAALTAALAVTRATVPPASDGVRRGRHQALGAWMALGVLVVSVVVIVVPQAQRAADPVGWLHFSTNDRSGVRALTAVRRPGDFVLVEDSAWSAVDWYGDLRALAPLRPVTAEVPGPRCDPGALAAAVRGYDRVLYYTGRLSNTKVVNAVRVLEARLAELGAVTDRRRWGDSRLVVVDLAHPPTTRPGLPPRIRATCVDFVTPRN